MRQDRAIPTLMGHFGGNARWHAMLSESRQRRIAWQ
ncbi:hypothetical protein DSM3645_03343 [Blastopirellula marina DSM 3645]|uniref:Uncharacterized protein n=1 Tax=Blastopirellula marina DSM 3645 TaxID=314230 RepID=A3ZVY2_9BACT|nr:hypothetical protein DSM3645_03343 [Blastopirellula marina DSM 3645]